MKRLVYDTGARIVVDRVGEMNSECLITGTPDAVQAAATMVRELMEV